MVEEFYENDYQERWEVTLPVLDPDEGGELEPSAIDRLGGAPIGVSIERWPRLTIQTIDEPMQHIVTIAAKHFEGIELPENTAAVALFVWNPEANEAFEPDTHATRVLFLTEEDLTIGEISERPRGYDATRELPTMPLVVTRQTGTFMDIAGDHIGLPIDWCQGREGEDLGPFLFQFGETLIDINLGDMGTMYVFRDAAWWQCF